MDYAYGNDISKWQLYSPYKIPPRFALTKERGIKLVCVKKSQGIAQDPAFKTTWTELKNHPELKRSVYHYFEPTVRADLQISSLLSDLKKEDITAPMWLDVERYHYMNRSVVLQRMLDMLYAMKDFSGRPVAIYTRKTIFDPYYSNKPGWGKDWLLVVAHYGVAEPMLPTGWGDWDGWQVSDRNGMGKVLGYASASVDIDLVKPVLLGE